MKIIIQRVKNCSVTRETDEKIVGKISSGLLLLLGIKKGDTEREADFLINKISKLRVMADGDGKMNLTVLDTESEVLVVSQFTLYADTSDGNRPSFIDAEEPKKAKILYDYFIEKLKLNGILVQTGSFGEYMKINCVLDGPVTITYEKNN